MKKTCLLSLMIFACILSRAEITPSWKKNFDSPVAWQKVTNIGYLIVSTEKALYGINPESGETLWENAKLGSIPIESFEEVRGTQFFSITIGGQISDVIIMNPMDGKEIFNSEQEGIAAVLSKHPLSRSGKLLIVGTKKGELSLTLLMYDVNTGELLWMNEDLFKVQKSTEGKSGFGAFMANLESTAATMGNISGLTADPLEMDNETLLLAHPNYIISLNAQSGTANWKTPIESSTRAELAIVDSNPGVVYASVETEQTSQTTSSSEPTTQYYNLTYALNAKDGKEIWAKPYKVKGQLNTMIFDTRGLIVCPFMAKPFINLVDYKTGVGKWGKNGKGIKIQGALVSYEEIDGAYLITTSFDNAWNNAAEEYYLNILDVETGTLRYEKYEKLNGDLRKTELLEKGLLYVTSREINIMDVKTGINILPKPVVAAKPLDPDNYDPLIHGLPFAEDDKVLIAYSSKDKLVYAIDKIEATLKQISKTEVDFEEKENPSTVELVEDGILLISDQNIMKLDWDGNTLYKSYFPSPQVPGLKKALHIANAVRAATVATAASAYAGAFAHASVASDDQATKNLTGEVAGGFGEVAVEGFSFADAEMKNVMKRFKASSQSPDFVFILSEYEKKTYGILQVSKATGKQIELIDLGKEKEPSYEVDQVYSYIYFRTVPNEIVCYQF
ncbi:MAG: PQQ-binding-like beta-propeller repeat protein [Bacteroidales bacterium]|nr:PQQ-binding-like beta-propeller repeat protein [Bacteroidales bacterium]